MPLSNTRITRLNSLIKMAANNASCAMFSTWELCEDILTFLPCDDLARARRFCPIFKKVVDQSAALWQSLLLSPRTSKSVWTLTGSVWTLTGKSFVEGWKTDKLFAGPDMGAHVQEAISRGETITELPVFELHPVFRVKRLNLNYMLGWRLRCCTMPNPTSSLRDATERPSAK